MNELPTIEELQRLTGRTIIKIERVTAEAFRYVFPDFSEKIMSFEDLNRLRNAENHTNTSTNYKREEYKSSDDGLAIGVALMTSFIVGNF